MVLWRTTRTYREFPWRSSWLIKRSFHHHLWRLPYTEVLVCHKQQVEVSHLNLSIEWSWVPFRCWVSLFLMGFTSVTYNVYWIFKSSLRLEGLQLFDMLKNSIFDKVVWVGGSAVGGGSCTNKSRDATNHKTNFTTWWLIKMRVMNIFYCVPLFYVNHF